MVWIVVGFLASVFFVYCLCVTAKRADEEMDQLMKERIESQKSKHI